jgi:hypothetical protein
MRFAKGYEKASPYAVLNPKVVAVRKQYNEKPQPAGVRVGLKGLYPLEADVRISLADDKPVVIDGPFAEAKEVIGS